jgi:putative sterol carrier protein
MRFLSPEHCQASSAAFAADAELQQSAAGVVLNIVYYVTDSPEGDFAYHLSFGPGGVLMARGALPAPDAEVRSSYATAVQMVRGELGNQTAVMLGKVRIKGSMMTLLRHQGVLNRTQNLSAALDVTY